MKPSARVNFLILTGSVLMLVGVFAEPLGIPSDFESIPILAAVLFIYFGYRASKKAKAAGEIPPASASQKRKRFALMVGSCAVACAAMLFVLPFTGVALPFAERVIVSIISFFICIGAFWLGMKMRA